MIFGVADDILAPTKAPLTTASMSLQWTLRPGRQKVIYKSMLHIPDKALAVLELFDRFIDTYQ